MRASPGPGGHEAQGDNQFAWGEGWEGDLPQWGEGP